MRNVIILVMVLAIAGTAIAQDGSSTRELPVKNKPNVTYTPPDEVKVGGDTVLDATEISGIPYSDTGNTMGFIDDYDEICPFSSTSPDVVYSFAPGSDMRITVDLCGSEYDTKTFIYDTALSLIACSDDFYGDGDPCGSWVSKMEGVPLVGGNTYYIVIDGWGGEFGNYILNVTDFEECYLTCPPDAVAEGEPPMFDGYDDNYNSGCNDDPPVLQTIDWANTAAGEAWLCGVSGWVLGPNGGNTRDTDWFTVTALGTEMTITVRSEYECIVVKMVAPECPAISEIWDYNTCGELATLTFPTTPNEEIWLAIAPTIFTGAVQEFQYFATLTGHVWDPPVATEARSWGGVKALYR